MGKSADEIRAVVKDMTLDEKIRCCALFEDRFANIGRLGTKYRCCDNSSGGGKDYFRVSREEVEKEGFWGTCFPAASAQGAAWDPEIAYEIGVAQGKECKNQEIDILLRPGVNMKRSPLCGRNFEYFSEDPVLTAELASAYINGVQSQHVGANLKHFVCNNQEYERMTTNAVVDERTFNEMYLRVFQLILEKSDPWTLMTCYNKVNGKWVHQNEYIMDKLRGEFGYSGLVMSDAFAVHYKEDKVEGHRKGLDTELAEEYCHADILREAVYSGEIPESVLDEIAFRLLDCYYKINDGYEVPELDLKAHHALAVRAAEGALVLLENDGILPLDPAKAGKLALIGGFAKEPAYMGGGSGHMNGHTLDTPYDKIAGILGGENFGYAAGYIIRAGFPPKDEISEKLIGEAVKTASGADTVLLFVGNPYGIECEGYDRPDLLLPESQRKLLEAVLPVSRNAVLIVSTGSAVDISAYTGRVRAVIQTGYIGEAIGSAAANVLFGLSEPGGRLSETYPKRLEDTPAYLSFPRYPEIAPDVQYGEGVFIGYRWYDAKQLEVAYPFGHGLSYTTFRYSSLKLDVNAEEKKVRVSFRVKNTGERTGSDVAQIYVRDPEASVRRPEKELRAFRKVRLEPGEEKEISLTLKRHAFEFYSAAMHKWVVEAGRFDILVGRSSRDIVLCGSVDMPSCEKPRMVGERTAAVHFVNDPKFSGAVRAVSEAHAEFLDPVKNPMVPLVAGVPLGQLLCDMDLGSGRLSREKMRCVVDEMNRD